jgi:hypothetical protein
MVTMIHPFGSWLPDNPAWTDPHLREARNVLPATVGYQPFPGLRATTNALAGRVIGAAATRDKDGVVRVYAGTATDLYELTSTTAWTARSGATYTASDSNRWRFAPYKDRMIATNYSNAIQTTTMSAGANFANLGGSPPNARFVSSFGEFLVCANTNASAMQVRWSSVSDPTVWTVGTNQADQITFPDGGLIRGLGYADVLYVFQEQAIRRIVYVGPPTIMNIDVIERGRGPVTANSIAQLGGLFFYLSEDGFYVFDGTSSRAIGAGKVDRWFAADHAPEYYDRMSAAVDPENQIVAWAYASRQSPTGQPDSVIVYNWTADRWAYARQSAHLIYSVLGKGQTLEGLDAIYTSGIDVMTISLDDPTWLGGSISLAGFTTGNAMGLFTGSNLEAVIEPSDLTAGQRLLVREAVPNADTTAATIAVGARERVGDAYTFRAAVSQQASGRVPVRASGRQFRPRVVIPAGSSWTQAFGVTLTGEPAGQR